MSKPLPCGIKVHNTHVYLGLVVRVLEQEMENQVVKMERATTSQPWGFSIEGGHGSEYFPKDTSIVVTGIANGSPADGILRSVPTTLFHLPICCAVHVHSTLAIVEV